MEKRKRIRPEPIAYENWTLPEERGYGSYLVEAEGPETKYVTDYLSYRAAGIFARRRTQYHESVRLTTILEPYEPPALD